MKLKRLGDGREFDVEAEPAAGVVRVTIDGHPAEYPLAETGDGFIVTIGTRKIRIAGENRSRSLLGVAGALNREFIRVENTRAAARGLASPELLAPMPGKILKVLVSEGQQVAAGDPLIVVEAMKMETTLSAESPAIIQKLEAAVGQMVEGGQLLIRFSPIPDSSAP